MKLIKFLLFLFLITIPSGQLTRIVINQSVAFYIHDFILAILLILAILVLSWRGKIMIPPAFGPLAIFFLIGFVSLFNSARFFPTEKIFVGGLFLVRFLEFAGLYLVVVNIFNQKQIRFWLNLLILDGVILAILGFLQLIFFYDLSFLAEFGWDPHVGRLVSTFLDPNFVGGFLVLTLNLILARIFLAEKKLTWFILASVIFLAVILTFSRSAYLALTVSLLVWGILKSKKLLAASIAAFIIATLIFPRVADRITGAASFDVTAQARIASWGQAAKIFGDNLLLGVGFNNFRTAQATYGFFDVGRGEGGHAGGGSDSSFLLVAATTGITGILVYLSWYFRFLGYFWKRRDKILPFAALICLLALLVHSQFVNSLFYPQIILWLAVFLGLTVVESQDVAKVKN